jgi:hypothetical protein
MVTSSISSNSGATVPCRAAGTIEAISVMPTKPTLQRSLNLTFIVIVVGPI